ncbi:tetraacyldisaccharide 4'-kinase [Zobellia sp. 1_MG-2023]|uniref:tetraacyldisaccharide 4'-kinase n=1 Tax=Zobellia sp. 1_MG-2023 TaxID=3062626 RepID=UPI0026E3FDEB|nr:tetraacyldisaccharide 4'-kinase [Zobellia sp. 1_MG-2023]MDO6820061.1 tetraacyldisaccharide 4'-kinase [Zobellia sp. 1_MG-2023]
MQVLRKILFPVSLIYALVVYFRNYFYDKGIFSSQSFTTPTICIGNLSAGGTGKTPMVELLVAMLKDSYKVAVLSRGYRRKSKGFVLARENATVDLLGDEPYQIFSKFPDIALAVDADRRNGIRTLKEKIQPEVILLDDAYQHRKVNCAFSILLTSYGHLYVDDWYLPTGNLRDSKKEAGRAQVIIVTKCPKDLSADARKRIVAKLKPKPYQEVWFTYLAYEDELKTIDTTVFFDTLKKKEVTLVTGIANPAPLVDYLKRKGLNFEHLKFKDHHDFSEAELNDLRQKQCILTTEKDFVRLKGKIDNLYYIPVKHKFFGMGEDALRERLQQFMK